MNYSGAVIVYSTKNLVPVFSAISGLIIAPVYSIFSLGAGVFADNFNFVYLFYFSAALYSVGLYLSKRYESYF